MVGPYDAPVKFGPRAASPGSTTADSTGTAATSHRSNLTPPITLNTGGRPAVARAEAAHLAHSAVQRRTARPRPPKAAALDTAIRRARSRH